MKDLWDQYYTEAFKSSSPKSNGVYSVLNDEWIKKPVQGDIPNIDKEKFNGLFEEWESKYDKLLNKNPNSDDIKEFIDDLYNLRRESIADSGEYGLGNLVFKEFRNLGYLDRLKEMKNAEMSKEFSLE